MSTPTLAIELADEAPSLRALVLERDRLTARLAEIGKLIDEVLADPDADRTGVKVTERRDFRVSVHDKDALDRHLFATGRHRLVTSAIRMPGATEQELYDALQHVQGVVGPTMADAARSINTGSLKAAIRKMAPSAVEALPGVTVEPTVTRSVRLVDES